MNASESVTSFFRLNKRKRKTFYMTYTNIDESHNVTVELLHVSRSIQLLVDRCKLHCKPYLSKLKKMTMAQQNHLENNSRKSWQFISPFEKLDNFC